MIQFLQQHWRLILELCFALFSLVFFILKKKPTTDISSFIAYECIEAIRVAERSGRKGVEKLTIAVAAVNKALLKQFPDIDINNYQSLIRKIIEAILTTPEKKNHL